MSIHGHMCHIAVKEKKIRQNKMWRKTFITVSHIQIVISTFWFNSRITYCIIYFIDLWHCKEYLFDFYMHQNGISMNWTGNNIRYISDSSKSFYSVLFYLYLNFPYRMCQANLPQIFAASSRLHVKSYHHYVELSHPSSSHTLTHAPQSWEGQESSPLCLRMQKKWQSSENQISFEWKYVMYMGCNCDSGRPM